MNGLTRVLRPLAIVSLAVLSLQPIAAQQASPVELGQPLIAQPASHRPDDPWIYRGTDIPHDKEWLFGELDNGVRYAVRENGVPPGQVAIRIRIDAGSLYETESERGYAHLLEHLLFRESKYLTEGSAIATWQRLGASFGSDTNAETTPTQTVYKLDLPNAGTAKLDESMRYLSGMIQAPALSASNLKSDVPIVLAEARENGGPGKRVGDATRELYFEGQLLANRSPIGTTQSLQAATPDSVRAFYDRWYRPENTVVVISGDGDPNYFAALVEQYFADWQGKGERKPEPDFGQPQTPSGADPEFPVGDATVLVEPNLPRGVGYAILRPWEEVTDNLEYNRGLLIDAIAQAIINRRLEARARAGGSYLFAQVSQEDISRSTDATFVNITPLGEDWSSALGDVRSVIEDALAAPPTQEEIDREIAEYDVIFVNQVEQRALQAGAKLADDIVNAVDIREAVASPEVILGVFRGMKDRFTPEAILDHTRKLFQGKVVRGMMTTQAQAEGSEQELRQALLEPVEADGSSRLAAASISFDELPPVGEPGTIVREGSLGVLGVQALEFQNGVRAALWRTDNEPGRVTVRVRFGQGYQAFKPEDAPYIELGQMALVGSGVGPLGQEELDRIATGRKLSFQFEIDDGTFVMEAQTRPADVADQLYLFAAKLQMPRWDTNPVIRAKAASELAYESYSTGPAQMLGRDLEFYLHGDDPRYATATPESIEAATPEQFREVWEPILKQGPVEVMVFGDVDIAATRDALITTFGALSPRAVPGPGTPTSRRPDTAKAAPQVIYHRGEEEQAAAVVAWPTGGGVAGLPESRQLEILSQIFANRLLDAVREKSGASYAPNVTSDWPVDVNDGGRILAVAQLPPDAVPGFFDEAQAIASDLATIGPSEDELQRVTEPLNQLLNRAMTGHTFWMYQLEGATFDQRRIDALPSLFDDYTETTPERMKELARKYLARSNSWELAVLPQGRTLAGVSASAGAGR